MQGGELEPGSDLKMEVSDIGSEGLRLAPTPARLRGPALLLIDVGQPHQGSASEIAPAGPLRRVDHRRELVPCVLELPKLGERLGPHEPDLRPGLGKAAIEEAKSASVEPLGLSGPFTPPRLGGRSCQRLDRWENRGGDRPPLDG
jgi:hypothetical protein